MGNQEYYEMKLEVIRAIEDDKIETPHNIPEFKKAAVGILRARQIFFHFNFLPRIYTDYPGFSRKDRAGKKLNLYKKRRKWCKIYYYIVVRSIKCKRLEK